MTVKVSIVVGNPKPDSRTRRVAELFATKLLLPGSARPDVIDLADHIDEVFTWPSERLAALSAAVADSDLAIFASPTYKGTYTGLLKAFLDRYPANGLAGVVAIPLQTGADLAHAMAPSQTLAPLLVELGAVVPGRGLFLPLSRLADADEVLAGAAAEYTSHLTRLAKVAAAAAPVRV